MSERSDHILIEDMIEAIERILGFTKDLSFDEFIADIRTSDAVLCNLQVLGEAANRISDGVRVIAGEIEWERIIRSRHIIVHNYFGIDYEIVWRIIEVHLPSLLDSLKVLHSRLL